MSNAAKVAEMLGAPEYLIERSASARAGAEGVTMEDVLARWAGDESAPAPSPEPAPDSEASEEAPAASVVVTPEEDSASTDTEADSEADTASETPEPPSPVPPTPVIPAPTPSPPPAPTPQPVPTAPPLAPAAATAVVTPPITTATYVPTTPLVDEGPPPPLLIKKTDRPFLLWWGGLLLGAIGLLFGFVLPAIPEDPDGVQTSAIWLGGDSAKGKEIYLEQGCAACHSQLVRPLVADAGLGAVTVADSNQVLGIRRIGPDLAHVGSRYEDSFAIIELLSGRSAPHHSYASLGEEDLAALAVYLIESR